MRRMGLLCLEIRTVQKMKQMVKNQKKKAMITAASAERARVRRYNK